MLFDVSNDTPSLDQATNVFLALMPPKSAAEAFYPRATDLCRRAGTLGSQRPPHILHMSLVSIRRAMGRAPGNLLTMADDALNMMRFPVFDIVLDEACSFETRQDRAPFVLGGAEMAGVEGVRLAARDALCVRGFNIPNGRSFTGHLTLSYSRHRARRMPVSPFSWTAREVWMIESWVGLTKYVKLGRWGLWDEPPRFSGPQRPTLH